MEWTIKLKIGHLLEWTIKGKSRPFSGVDYKG